MGSRSGVDRPAQKSSVGNLSSDGSALAALAVAALEALDAHVASAGGGHHDQAAVHTRAALHSNRAVAVDVVSMLNLVKRKEKDEDGGGGVLAKLSRFADDGSLTTYTYRVSEARLARAVVVTVSTAAAAPAIRASEFGR